MSVAFVLPPSSVPAFESYVPSEYSVALATYLDGMRKARLKEKYPWGTGIPELPRESCPSEQLARADSLRSLADQVDGEDDREKLRKKATRAEMCLRVAEMWECPNCGAAYKRSWRCLLRSCPACGQVIHDRAFSELLPLQDHIPACLASFPGWHWKILDLTFRHDGDFPTREEMRKMRAVVNRVADRAVYEKYGEMFLVRSEENSEASWPVKKCRLRFRDDGMPMLSADGWPVVSAPDGSARVLKGWMVVQVGRIEKRPTCVFCGSRVSKIKRERARLCPHCGRLEWPDWENQEVDNRRWKLRFGILHIVVSEFGYSKETGSPNFNYHFHTCFFGPYLEQARLVEILREESRKGLGVESRGVHVEKAKKGYRSALAHALKYTKKLPATTPDGLAKYEQVLMGVRRYAVRGFLQGVALDEKKAGAPKCQACDVDLRRVPGIGLVPLSEIEDVPFLSEKQSESAECSEDDESVFYQPEEMAANAPRAPC